VNHQLQQLLDFGLEAEGLFRGSLSCLHHELLSEFRPIGRGRRRRNVVESRIIKASLKSAAAERGASGADDAAGATLARYRTDVPTS
jgi:hypothetical protein